MRLGRCARNGEQQDRGPKQATVPSVQRPWGRPEPGMAEELQGGPQGRHMHPGAETGGIEGGRGQGRMRPMEPWRTADRWSPHSQVAAYCLPLLVCATHHLLRHTGVQGPWSLSPQPAPARPPPTLPTSEAPRSRTVCCKPRNVPQSAQRDVGGQREAGDPVERQSRAKLGPWGQSWNC